MGIGPKSGEQIEFVFFSDFQNLKALVIPAVSEFNRSDVSAIDFLIKDFNLPRVGIFDSTHINPMIQPGATTAMELFGSAETGIWAIQIRSFPTNKKKLFDQLLEFSKQFHKVFVLGSVSSHLNVPTGKSVIGEWTNQEIHLGGMLKYWRNLAQTIVEFELAGQEGDALFREVRTFLQM